VAAVLAIRNAPGRLALFAAALAAACAAAVAGQGLWLLAVLAIVPVALAIYFRPQRGILLVAALAPFNGLLLIVQVPGFARGWKEALVGASLAATFVCPRSARGARGRSLPRWLPALAGLVVVALLSAVSIGGDQALLGLKVNLYYVLVAVAVWRAPLDQRERDRLVTILMATGFVCSVIGLAQQALGDVRLNDLGYQYNSTIRFSGDFLRSFSTFDQPFPFALFVMVTLLVGIPVALEDPTRVRNRVFLLATPIYLLGILSALVRAAWLGLAVGLLYLAFRRYRALLWFIPLAVVAFLLVAGPVSSTLLSSTSLQARTQGWQGAIQQVEAHPLGVGIGSAGAVAERLAGAASKSAYQPDNYYFKTVYELGVLGLWMLVLLLIGIFRAVHVGAARARAPDRALLDGIAAVVLASMVASLVDSYFEIFPLDLTFWLLIGLAAAMVARTRGSGTELVAAASPTSAPAPVDAGAPLSPT
jgi:hypothetical protein